MIQLLEKKLVTKNCSSCVDKVLDVLYDKDVPSLQALTNELAEARGDQYDDIVKRYEGNISFRTANISKAQFESTIQNFDPGETALVCVNYKPLYGGGSHIFNALNDGEKAVYLDGQDVTGIFQNHEAIIENTVYLIILKEKIADKFIY